MDVLTAIQSRRSIRQYSAREIEEDRLLKVLEAGRLAPSARNRQEWKFILVRDKNKREKLVDATMGQLFVGQAPAIIVACATEAEGVMACGQPMYTIDMSIALSYMMLEAREIGLGTCWLGRFDEDAVKKALDIPAKMRVVAMSPLGYPSEDPVQRPRKRLDEVVCYDGYSE